MHELELRSSTPQLRTNFLTPNHPEWSRLNFPHRLHHLLAAMEVEGRGHIAHWDEHGLCFKIRKTDELIQNYLPFFFQQRKWKSFQRQMNIYSFKRIPSGPHKGYYCHPFFKRSDISMAQKILRKKQKSELSSEALIRASQDHQYSCDTVSPWLCLSPQPTRRTTTTLDFSLKSSCDEARDVDFLLGYHRISCLQGCPRMDQFNKKASRDLRPLVLVSLSPDSEESTASGAGFRSYNNCGGMYREYGMDDAAMFQAGIEQVSSYFITGDAGAVHRTTDRAPFDLSEKQEDWRGSADHDSFPRHLLALNSDGRGFNNYQQGQRRRGLEDQVSDILDDDNESIATIDDLTSLMILNFDAGIEQDFHRNSLPRSVFNEQNRSTPTTCILST